jgi:hypothetical protein
LLYLPLGARDRNPNPIAFGIMAMFTFFPALACMLGGAVESAIRFNRAKNQLPKNMKTVASDS